MNPVMPIFAAVLYSIPMLFTIDVVSAAVALAIWLVLFLAAGIGPPKSISSRCVPGMG